MIEKIKLPVYAWIMIVSLMLYFAMDNMFWLWVTGFMAAIRIISGKKQAEDMAFIIICFVCVVIAIWVLYGMICRIGHGNPRYDYYY